MSDLVQQLRDLHVFDAAPERSHAWVVLRPWLWRAYCSCGWRSYCIAWDVAQAAQDHRQHLRTLRGRR